MFIGIAHWFCAVFALWSLMWWILTIGFVYVLFNAIDREDVLASSISVFVYLCVLNFISGVPLLAGIAAHPNIAVGIGIGYVVLGVIWSFIKWGLFVKRDKNTLLERRIDFLKNNGIKNPTKKTSIPIELKNKWIRLVGFEEPEALQALAFKTKIAGWIAYWPISFIWSFFADFVKDFFEHVFEVFRNYYQGIANVAYKDVKMFEDEDKSKEENS